MRRLGLTSLGAAQETLSASAFDSSQFLANKAVNIGQTTFDFIVNLCVMLYLLFFLLRDGDALSAHIKHAIPLSVEQKNALFRKFTIVIRASVKGDMLVALLQGLLGGLIFSFLGITTPLLWAVLMAFLSLLPVVGAALVWFPVAIYFLTTGAVWQGVALVAYGALVIGLVDNVLASRAGRQRHQDARIRCADFYAGRYHDVRFQRSCYRASDRGDVHRQLGHICRSEATSAQRPRQTLNATPVFVNAPR